MKLAHQFKYIYSIFHIIAGIGLIFVENISGPINIVPGVGIYIYMIISGISGLTKERKGWKWGCGFISQVFVGMLILVAFFRQLASISDYLQNKPVILEFSFPIFVLFIIWAIFEVVYLLTFLPNSDASQPDVNCESNNFWKNQFSEESTSGQFWFDVFFGIVAPILCIIFDPIVFRGIINNFGRGYLENIKLFAYISITLGIITLSVWLFVKIESKMLIAFFAGIFLSGTILAFSLGVALFPLSVLSLGLILGILGFTPFLTSFVFLRNSRKTFQAIKANSNKALIGITILSGIILVVGIPLVIQRQASNLVSESIYMVIHSTQDEEINIATSNLRMANFWCSTSCYDEIVWAYEEEESEVHRQILSEAYYKITGWNIDNRLEWFQID